MSDESEFESIPQDKMNSMGTLAKEARELQATIDGLTDSLNSCSERLRIILEKEMPDIMMELGMESIKLISGEKLVMTKFYSASIKPEFQEVAFQWLRDNGHDSIIKNKVEGSFGKGEDEKFQEIMKLLEDAIPGVFTAKTSVHAMTLKSFVKEQIEAGREVPAEPFGIFIGNKVKIK